ETDQHRGAAADEEHDARENQVHRADVLVIGRVHPAPPAVRLVIVIVVRLGVCQGFGHGALSRNKGVGLRGGSFRHHEVPAPPAAAATAVGAAAGTSRAVSAGWPAGVAGAAACFCSAAFCFSHVAKSSLERASTTIGMKPWSRPQSSAHCPRYNPGLSLSIL